LSTTQAEGWKRTRQTVSIKGRQAGWDLGNRRDATEERARLTLEAGVRKLVIGDVKIS
jgi:hypothetical protein